MNTELYMVHARRAAAHLADLFAIIRDAGLEVDARGGCRMARSQVQLQRNATVAALLDLAYALQDIGPAATARRLEVAEMIDGVRDGYARESWALRVVALAAEVGT